MIHLFMKYPSLKSPIAVSIRKVLQDCFVSTIEAILVSMIIIILILAGKRLLGFIYPVFREGGHCCLSKLYESSYFLTLIIAFGTLHTRLKLKHLERMQSLLPCGGQQLVVANSWWSRDAHILKCQLKWPSLAAIAFSR